MSDRVDGSGPMLVHAWLDVGCPWCRIAKRRFEEAVADYGRPVTVDYHSFELAPDLPDGYLSTEADFLQHLYPGTTAADAAMKMRLVVSTGARLGLTYDFDAVRHTTTFPAHQLLQHGKAHGVQPELLEALFTAFFEQGRDLRQVDELVTIGAGVGLDADVTRAALLDGSYADAVREDQALATAHGVTTIPTYLLPGQPPINGASRPAVLLEALRRVAP